MEKGLSGWAKNNPVLATVSGVIVFIALVTFVMWIIDYINSPSTRTDPTNPNYPGKRIPTTEGEKAAARQAFVDNLNQTINGRKNAELPKCNCESVDIPAENGGGSYLSKYRTGEGASCSDGCLFNVNSGLPSSANQNPCPTGQVRNEKGDCVVPFNKYVPDWNNATTPSTPSTPSRPGATG